MKVLADGKLLWTICKDEPANPAAPTVTELNAGIEASRQTLTSDFNFTNAASATFEEKALSVKGQSMALGISNYDLGATFIREYDPEGGADVAGGDEAYQAVKEKGTTVWAYARESEKDSVEPWEEGDEIYLGGEIQSDTPARVNNDGNIKRRVPFIPVAMVENVTVAVGTP